MKKSTILSFRIEKGEKLIPSFIRKFESLQSLDSELEAGLDCTQDENKRMIDEAKCFQKQYENSITYANKALEYFKHQLGVCANLENAIIAAASDKIKALHRSDFETAAALRDEEKRLRKLYEEVDIEYNPKEE